MRQPKRSDLLLVACMTMKMKVLRLIKVSGMLYPMTLYNVTRLESSSNSMPIDTCYFAQVVSYVVLCRSETCGTTIICA